MWKQRQSLLIRRLIVFLLLLDGVRCARAERDGDEADRSSMFITDAKLKSMMNSNKFMQRSAFRDFNTKSSNLADEAHDVDTNTSESASQSHNRGSDARLRWVRELDSSIYSTPIVTHLHGVKAIVASGVAVGVQALEGSYGARINGFENGNAEDLSGSTVHASPIMYDINSDGLEEILLATYDGEILFFFQNGSRYFLNMKLPRIQVKRDWYVGLNRNADNGERDVDDDSVQEIVADEQKKQSGTASRRRLMMEHDEFDFFDYDDYDYDYYDHVGYEAYEDWDHEFYQEQHTQQNGVIDVDPHILATPAIADIDNDGHDELVVSVSYFFDKFYYESIEHKSELDSEIDINNYFASGVVVYDLQSLEIKWKVHLDMSTSYADYTATMYASPTVADINSDGLIEVLVATGVGFVYAFSAYGSDILGWPIQMARIQGQVAVSDINNDRKPEIIAADINGNVAAFDSNGKEIWESHLGSTVLQAVSIGDIDGDGNLEVVVCTMGGYVFALRGRDGSSQNGFPFQTHGRIMAPSLLIKAHDKVRGLQIVVPSFDGYLYIIDGHGISSDKIDIGEVCYAMPLLDDLDGNGLMELVISSMSGNILVFELPFSRFDPLKSVLQQVPAPGNFAARYEYQGIAADTSSRNQDCAGKSFVVKVNIVDKRNVPPERVTDTDNKAKEKASYIVTITLKAHSIDSHVAHWEFHDSGQYTLVMDSLPERTSAMVFIEMVDESHTHFTDSFPVTFHMNIYKSIKYVVAGPITIVAFLTGVIFTRKRQYRNLPS